MGVLDDAIREHLELKRQHGAGEDEIAKAEAEALGPARREPPVDPYAVEATDQELALILDYLAKNFPAEEIPPVNVNTAPAIELESRLSLRRSQAAAVIAYREKNGRFKSIEDLKKVPGVDAEKIDAKKDRIVF